MGIYGSPDTGNLYTNEKSIKKWRKPKLIYAIDAILIILYLLMFINTNDKFGMTIAYIGIMSISYFILYFVRMVIKLIKKESVNSEVVRLLITIAIIIICLFLS